MRIDLSEKKTPLGESWRNTKIIFFLIEAIPVWQLKLPKLGSESNIRLVNITKDAHLDIIMGFGTGADGYDVPEFVCDIYFNGQVPCFGGMCFLNLKAITSVL